MMRLRRSNALPRPKYRAARAFYLTLFIGTCFATYALLTHSYSPTAPRPLRPRAQLSAPSTATLSADDECRRVHTAPDQCAYVHAHCPNDEAGFTLYLDLYYCRLQHAKAVAFLVLISWLGLLFSTIGIAASDFFCIDLSTISGILGMSESMAGVTFLAFGNGSPDVFSTFAAMSTNSGSLAVGELFGAAGFITAVVAGSMALIRPFQVAKKSFIRDVGFFTVAAAFSMVFLWDGKLHFWECAVMVAYYIFYVAFVVVWHWWLGRRRRRREKEAAARGHFISPGDELEFEEEYRDDPDDAPDPRRPSITRAASQEDWTALEGGSAAMYEGDHDEDDEEEARDKWMSELASNMRLTRRGPRARANTVTPVRPSLVGALEFQAVLKSLQKSRNIQTIPMASRRYSDDPTYTTMQQQDQMSSISDPAARPGFEIHVTEGHSPLLQRPEAVIPTPMTAPALTVPSVSRRTRAVSANDAAALRISSEFQNLSPVQSEDNSINFASHDDRPGRPQRKLTVPSLGGDAHLPSPTLTVEPATPRREAPLYRPTTPASTHSGDLLAPPGSVPLDRQSSDYFMPRAPSRQGTDESDKTSPRLVPRARQLPKIVIPKHERSLPSSRGTSPFPAYRDHPSPSVTASPGRSGISSRAPSIYLPDPHPNTQPDRLGSPESIPADLSAEQEVPRRPGKLNKFWPYHVMPPPGVIIRALLPTIYHWEEKTWWEKMLGIVAAPSVFLLTLTLPVVENDRDNIEESTSRNASYDSARSKSVAATSPGALKSLTPEYTIDPPQTPPPGSHSHTFLSTEGLTGMGNTATIATYAEQHSHHNYGMNAHHLTTTAEPQTFVDDIEQTPPEPWNRWLTIIQLFLAPIFIVLSIYTQAPDGLEPSWLIRSILICLLVSVVLLIPLLLTTTPTHRPDAYRAILSLAGFVVSIAWISAVAGQVVGALKALAVILNMSHAIMGLTIFAVGNSLGDLVADVTVAKLGYPVMALSACFGGPMLNILLGVGLSGSWILIRGAERRHEKHPHSGIKFHSYHIEVSKTLIVSGVTLLITLLGLLIFVPLNQWVLSKRIGWALIAVWTVSTIFNVVIEVTGFLGDVEIAGMGG